MKLKIKIKVLTEGCLPQIREEGDWIDLRAAKDVQLGGKNKKTLIPLGVVIKLPKGFEAIISPRSSAFKNFGFIQTNSIGVIDQSYQGPKDEWKLPVYSVYKGEINKGDRICQFRIQLTQKATFIQKLKWLLSSGIKLEVIKEIKGPNRHGFGHSGVK